MVRGCRYHPLRGRVESIPADHNPGTSLSLARCHHCRRQGQVQGGPPFGGLILNLTKKWEPRSFATSALLLFVLGAKGG